MRLKSLSLTFAAAFILITWALSVAAETAKTADEVPRVHTATTEPRTGERLKTIPISKNPWGAAKSVVSLGPQSIGKISQGDRLEAALDMETTVCLKPNALHPGSGQPCVGKMYSYDPNFRTKIVLAPNERATAPSKTLQISPTVQDLCTQKQPNRNHHCRVEISWSGINFDDLSELPCDPNACYVNVVMSAYHKKAKPGEQVVLGSSDDNKHISQGRAKLSTVLYEPAGQQPERVYQTDQTARSTAPVVAKGAKENFKVIASLPLRELRAGNQLKVDARAVTRINKLPYIVFQRTELILTDSPGSVSEKDRVASKTADSPTRVGVSNGYNCTQGASGHTDPCRIQKTGILSIRQGSPKTLYLNLIVGTQAHGISTQYNKWKPSDVIGVESAEIEAQVYKGDASCSSCQTGGGPGSGKTFGPGDNPKGRDGELVNRLRKLEITQGRYSCFEQTGRHLVTCPWYSKGQFGDSRQYECDQKAFYDTKKKRWDVKPCKDAIGAQLWHLIQERGEIPTYTGVCDEQPSKDNPDRLRCKWFADGVRDDQSTFFCKGYATYSLKSNDWTDIDRCRDPRA